MTSKNRNLKVRLADSEHDVLAAQRLRYNVFVRELGAGGPGVNHQLETESDSFDAWSEHLLLIDTGIPEDTLDYVVGVYRLLRSEVASRKGGFYSSTEFDLSPLLALGRPQVELGRTCVHADYRGGASMYLLWNGLANYVLKHEIEIMFGTASFIGTAVRELTLPLSYLHHCHLAPPELRVMVHAEHAASVEILPRTKIDKRKATRQLPSLIRAYLRLGGFIGSGAYVDRDFNTVDVCLVMDTVRMNAQRRDYYERSWSKD